LTRSDGELVSQAQAGNVEAFDELMRKHNQRVYVLARRMLGNVEDAADVHQEAFLLAWRNLKRFRGDSEFSTWLCRITMNLCLSRKRLKSATCKHVSFDEELVGHSEGGLDADLARREMVIAARQILESLPANYRALLILRELEGRSYQEIAEIMDCSLDTVKTGLRRARKMALEKAAPEIDREGNNSA